MRTKTPTDYDVNQGAGFRAGLATLGQFPILRAALRELLQATDNDSMEGGKRSGRLNPGALHRLATGAETVFRRRTVRDGVQAAVGICVDGSISMSNCMRDAVRSAVILAEVATTAGARVEVSVFHDAYGDQDSRALEDAARDPLRTATDDDADDDVPAGTARTAEGELIPFAYRLKQCRLDILKAYADPIGAVYARAWDAQAGGCTPDLAALTATCDRLLAQDAGRRVAVFITDGQGDAETLMAQAVRKYSARGVLIIAIGIGYLPTCEAYPYRVEVASARDLGGAAMRTVLAAVQRAAEAQDRPAPIDRMPPGPPRRPQGAPKPYATPGIAMQPTPGPPRPANGRRGPAPVPL